MHIPLSIETWVLFLSASCAVPAAVSWMFLLSIIRDATEWKHGLVNIV